MIKNIKTKDEIIVYQAKNGAIELKEDLKSETVWASQAQIADIFGIDRSVATRHIGNILKDKELNKNSVCANFAHTAGDGKIYKTQFYNLDVILAVGYRTNSSRAITFRQWATKTLRTHIIRGYTINKKQLAKNYNTFLKAVEEVKKLLPENNIINAQNTIELIKVFASTWFSLNAYDKSILPKNGATKKEVFLTANDLETAIFDFKKQLIIIREASELFAQERTKDAVSAIIGNVFQSFGGEDLYQTAEEKAAHLLYFMVKNHPFVDGNKRSGAFAFVWFLKQAELLNTNHLSPEALTALTLLVAESKPADKERMIGLILMILNI